MLLAIELGARRGRRSDIVFVSPETGGDSRVIANRALSTFRGKAAGERLRRRATARAAGEVSLHNPRERLKRHGAPRALETRTTTTGSP